MTVTSPTLSAPTRRKGGVSPRVEAKWRAAMLAMLLDHPDVWQEIASHVADTRDDRGPDDVAWPALDRLHGALVDVVTAMDGAS